MNDQLQFSFHEYSIDLPLASHRTYCEIELTSNGRLLAIGTADCSKKDSFNIIKGRKIAMTRAMQAAKIPTGRRHDAWQVFLQAAKDEQWQQASSQANSS